MEGLAYEVAGTFLEDWTKITSVSASGTDDQQYFLYAFPPLRQEPMDVLDDDDFIRIVDFNKLPVLSFLGNAVSEQCEAVLF